MTLMHSCLDSWYVSSRLDSTIFDRFYFLRTATREHCESGFRGEAVLTPFFQNPLLVARQPAVVGRVRPPTARPPPRCLGIRVLLMGGVVFHQGQTGNDEPPKNRLAPLQVPIPTASGGCGTGTIGQAPDLAAWEELIRGPLINQSICDLLLILLFVLFLFFFLLNLCFLVFYYVASSMAYRPPN